MVRGALALRVTVGDADVGRVGRRGDDLRQAGLARRARRVAANAALLQAVEVIGLELGRDARVQLREEGGRARRADGIAAVAVLNARVARDADTLRGAGLDVGAQTAEIGSPAGAEGVVRRPRVAELQL